MPHYVDGFVHPIPNDCLEDYKHLATTIAGIWKEYGAIDYWECTGDDMQLEGTRPFPDVINANDDETVLFGWVVFESREARDLANEKVAADPRMGELMSAVESGFDAQRMAYGGFQSFLPQRQK